MLDMISNFLTTVDDFVWGIPLIVLILATGLFLTARLRFLQITKLPHAIKHLIANEKSGEDGEVSSFAALCTALSATIGTGNIVGVATAIVAGGPGALFWMWIAALVGTATKYSECLLAVKYRVVAEELFDKEHLDRNKISLFYCTEWCYVFRFPLDLKTHFRYLSK